MKYCKYQKRYELLQNFLNIFNKINFLFEKIYTNTWITVHIRKEIIFIQIYYSQSENRLEWNIWNLIMEIFTIHKNAYPEINDVSVHYEPLNSNQPYQSSFS